MRSRAALCAMVSFECAPKSNIMPNSYLIVSSEESSIFALRMAFNKPRLQALELRHRAMNQKIWENARIHQRTAQIGENVQNLRRLARMVRMQRNRNIPLSRIHWTFGRLTKKLEDRVPRETQGKICLRLCRKGYHQPA